MKKKILALTAATLFSASASASTVFFQGFETDTSDWFGNVTQVADGFGGITSFEGSKHAVFSDGGGQFTRFDGYRNTWPNGGMIASAAVYLDTGWASGEGFDYTVAANGTDNAHQRDFIFHVTKDETSGLLVGGSNNSNNGNLNGNLGAGNHYAVTTSDWYIFEHDFYDDGGVLAVDLNLRDSGGSLLFTETRTNGADLIPSIVGGNRYGWFPVLKVGGGIEVDATSLALSEVPIPAAAWLFGSALLGLMGVARRKKV